MTERIASRTPDLRSSWFKLMEDKERISGDEKKRIKTLVRDFLDDIEHLEKDGSRSSNPTYRTSSPRSPL